MGVQGRGCRRHAGEWGRWCVGVEGGGGVRDGSGVQIATGDSWSSVIVRGVMIEHGMGTTTAGLTGLFFVSYVLIVGCVCLNPQPSTLHPDKSSLSSASGSALLCSQRPRPALHRAPLAALPACRCCTRCSSRLASGACRVTLSVELAIPTRTQTRRVVLMNIVVAVLLGATIPALTSLHPPPSSLTCTVLPSLHV